MAQWLVFLNGIILTFIAYLALSFFINQSVQEDYKRAGASAVQSISERFAGFENIIRTAAALLDENRANADPAQRMRAIAAIPHIDMLTSLMLIHRADGAWRADSLYTNPAQHAAALPPAETLGPMFLQALAQNKGDVRLLTLPQEVLAHNSTDPDVSDRPIVVVRSLRNGAGEIDAIVAGFSKGSSILDSEWLHTRPSMIHLMVGDLSSKQPIYELKRAIGGGDDAFKLDMASVSSVAGTNIQIGLNLLQYSGVSILQKIPLLLLLFGGCLTLIGTLYIRTNRKQSLRLAAMNRVLAKKNYELNSEVAERERLNEFLRNAEREYRAIVNSVSDIIFETNAEGDIVFLNTAWERITGFDVPQSIDRSLFDMLHVQDQEEQRQNFRELVRGKRHSFRVYTRLRKSDGTFRSVEMSVSMLRLDENRKTRVVGSFTDVEERRRAERALGEAEKKYRAIVENAAGGIFQMTPEGQILSANPSMARILGFENADRMLRDVRSALDYLFIVARDRTKFLRELMLNGMVKNLEVQGRNAAGDKIWLNINARSVSDNEGNILYFEGSLENITQRKDAELALREAKIQSDLSSRAKSEFLANMSHELRTPLNAIIGFSEIIKNEVLGPLENRQYWEYSSDIYSSGKKLLSIINEILDVSRIDAGDRQLNEASVDLTKIVTECIGFIGPRVREGKLKLTNLIEGRIPALIGEELAIKQILLNLLSNAVKFTPEGGRVTLSYEIDNDGQMLVSVTDTGIGLDETEIEKALSPFGQVDSTLSRSGSGAGLGLTLVDSLIKLHGGRLELFSQKGIGTTATVVFPARRVGVRADEKPQGPSSSLQSGDAPARLN